MAQEEVEKVGASFDLVSAIALPMAEFYNHRMASTTFQINPAQIADLDAVIELFKAYAASLNINLSYQDFEMELATLPGKYAPPEGALLLAKNLNDEPIGCVALRPLTVEACCEMKRLYVSPKARGLGLGQALITAILDEASKLGYTEMRLDTLPAMTQAISLYEKAGFLPIEPYYETPIGGNLFFAKKIINPFSKLVLDFVD
jgi:ribosomal protein S18 acetylase RimI-like enzyme